MSIKDGPELYESKGSVRAFVWIVGIAAFTLAILLAVCTPGHAAECKVKIEKRERYVSRAVKKEVFRKAGIPWERRSNFVVDHVCPLRLGCSNEPSNLQLQSKEDGIRKDIVEGFLNRCVCREETTLQEAQRLVKRWKRVDSRGACP